jgi:hypothetical protein
LCLGRIAEAEGARLQDDFANQENRLRLKQPKPPKTHAIATDGNRPDRHQRPSPPPIIDPMFNGAFDEAARRKIPRHGKGLQGPIDPVAQTRHPDSLQEVQSRAAA